MRSVCVFAACALLGGADDSPSTDDSWVTFPLKSGVVLIHKDCVHRFDDADFQEEKIVQGPCPHAPRYITASDDQANTTKLGDARYYSDWVAYAKTLGDFGYMSSEWTVPTAPQSHGPVPGMSSSYLFNGLEDGGGVKGAASYILQPVLSYGKSGCVINPVDFFRWFLISFSVGGDGRARCGKKIAVKEGERVRGVMQLEQDGTSWSTISTRLTNNDTSVVTTALASNKQPNAAYNTFESMITYSCEAYPKSGSVTFENNVLKDRGGKYIGPPGSPWQAVLRHQECNQQVKINSDDSVTLTWDSTKTSSSVIV